MFGRKKAKNGKKPSPPVHDDLVQRVFTAENLDELWLTDITEYSAAEAKLRLCAVKDACSGQIVGYSMDSWIKARLAVNAIENAVARRGGMAGCVVHSDRGAQFRARKLVHTLIRCGLAGSMGRAGASGDNAAMESFFSLLLGNVLDRRRWNTRQELRIAIVTWVERTYHRRRRQARLGRLTPIEFETIKTTRTAAAA